MRILIIHLVTTGEEHDNLIYIFISIVHYIVIVRYLYFYTTIIRQLK